MERSYKEKHLKQQLLSHKIQLSYLMYACVCVGCQSKKQKLVDEKQNPTHRHDKEVWKKATRP